MKILILAGGGVGDILMTTPMFRAIKKSYPNSILSVGVLGNLNMKLLAYNNNIDHLFLFDDEKYRGIFGILRLIFTFRKSNFEFCFHNHIGAGKKSFIIPFLSGIKNRIGYNRINVVKKKRGYRVLVKLLTRSYFYVYGDKRRTLKNLELLEILGINPQDESYDLGTLPWKNAKSHSKILGIHPGSDHDGRIKRWDIKKFNILALKMKSEFKYRVRFYIGPQERELIDSLENIQQFEIIEEKEMSGLIRSMGECEYFISNDSGLAHLASALNIPSVVIFGPTAKNEYILPTKNSIAEVNDLSCRPCFYQREICPNQKQCLKNLRVEDVLDAFKRIF